MRLLIAGLSWPTDRSLTSHQQKYGGRHRRAVISQRTFAPDHKWLRFDSPDLPDIKMTPSSADSISSPITLCVGHSVDRISSSHTPLLALSLPPTRSSLFILACLKESRTLTRQLKAALELPIQVGALKSGTKEITSTWLFALFCFLVTRVVPCQPLASHPYTCTRTV